jgi:hypothetical protein
MEYDSAEGDVIDVQVERPVTIKAGGKTIKLTDEQARELARKLSDVLGISTYPRVPWSEPYTLPTTPLPCYGTTDHITIIGDDLTCPNTSAPTYYYGNQNYIIAVQ